MSATQTPEQNDWVRRVLGIDPAENRSAAAAAAPPAALYAKSRMAWVATRAKVESDIARLHGALTSTYRGHGAAEHLEKAFQARVEAMMNALDHSLAEKLDEVNQAADAGQRARLVQEARQIMQRYESYLASEPLIAKLDANPFVPVAIEKTLTATLAALSKAVR
jgi:hypothetical protein